MREAAITIIRRLIVVVEALSIGNDGIRVSSERSIIAMEQKIADADPARPPLLLFHYIRHD